MRGGMRCRVGMKMGKRRECIYLIRGVGSKKFKERDNQKAMLFFYDSNIVLYPSLSPLPTALSPSPRKLPTLSSPRNYYFAAQGPHPIPSRQGIQSSPSNFKVHYFTIP
jgi:hypothetical protein